MIDPYIPCTTVELTPDQKLAAARLAVELNPANAAPLRGLAALSISDPQHLASLTGLYWGPAGGDLSVQFLDTPDAETRRMILSPDIGMNSWGRVCKWRFRETSGEGDVRILRANGGYASYIGVGIRIVAKGQPTMWLQGFTAKTPDFEYRRVVKHETGHTMGFVHEHLRPEIVRRIDPEKAYVYFWNTQKWNKSTVDGNVLTPVGTDTIKGSPLTDVDSIMAYGLPGGIMRDGVSVPGGRDITLTDAQWANILYPGSYLPPPPPPPPPVIPASALRRRVYSDGDTVWWWTEEGRRIDRNPYPGYKGEIRVASDMKFVATCPGPGGGAILVCYNYATGDQTCVVDVFPGFRGGAFPCMRTGWGVVSVTPGDGGGPQVAEFDPATGRKLGSEYRGRDNSTRHGLTQDFAGDPPPPSSIPRQSMSACITDVPPTFEDVLLAAAAFDAAGRAKQIADEEFKARAEELSDIITAYLGDRGMSESQVEATDAHLRGLANRLRQIVEPGDPGGNDPLPQENSMSGPLDAALAELNDATNLVAAKVEELRAKITTSMTPEQVTEAQATLGAIAGHLRAIASDPADPVPAAVSAALKKK